MVSNYIEKLFCKGKQYFLNIKTYLLNINK